MNDERFYEILGLKPYASREEIKAAYRDMAKVWHPDRFLHDPQLQQKAQEKLKEINEAYKQLSSASRATRRSQHARDAQSSPPPRPPRARYDAPPATVVRLQQTKPRRPLFPVFAAVAVAGVVFFAASRMFMTNRDAIADAGAPVSSTSTSAAGYESEVISTAGEQKDRKAASKQKATEADVFAPASDAQAPVRALPTASRTVDPTTGLLATRACPSRMLMTYPAGSEPQSYCGADHAPRQSAPPAQASQARTGEPAQPEAKGKSRVKSVVGAITNPGKWFKKKKETSPAQAKEPS